MAAKKSPSAKTAAKKGKSSSKPAVKVKKQILRQSVRQINPIPALMMFVHRRTGVFGHTYFSSMVF